MELYKHWNSASLTEAYIQIPLVFVQLSQFKLTQSQAGSLFVKKKYLYCFIICLNYYYMDKREIVIDVMV